MYFVWWGSLAPPSGKQDSEGYVSLLSHPDTIPRGQLPLSVLIFVSSFLLNLYSIASASLSVPSALFSFSSLILAFSAFVFALDPSFASFPCSIAFFHLRLASLIAFLVLFLCSAFVSSFSCGLYPITFASASISPFTSSSFSSLILAFSASIFVYDPSSALLPFSIIFLRLLFLLIIACLVLSICSTFVSSFSLGLYPIASASLSVPSALFSFSSLILAFSASIFVYDPSSASFP